MRKTNIKIVRFWDAPFYIDIVDAGDLWEAWLHHNRYGVQDYMFGWPKVQHPKGGKAERCSFDRFCELVEANLPEYEASFMEEHEGDL